MQDLDTYIMDQYNDFARRLRIKQYFNNSDNIQNDSNLRVTFKNTEWQPPRASAPVELYLNTVKEKFVNRLASMKQRNTFPNKRFYTPNPPWLTKTLTGIKENKEIIVTEADKNMGTVVIKTSEYIKHALGQLNNQNIYISCETEPDFEAIWFSLKEILAAHDSLHFTYYNKEKKLTDTAKYLLQLENRKELALGSFYLLMKVHKTPVAGRPIVSSINTITYFASKYIDRELQPIYKSIPSFLKSSQELLTILETLKFTNNRNCYILCADVDSLYPNIPIQKGLLMMEESIRTRNTRTSEKTRLSDKTISLIMDLMKFVLDNNYFTFGNLIFKQKDGTAMGTPAAVVFACLFLDTHETRVIRTTGVKPILYKRYIDDIFAVFKTEADAKTFINAFSNDVNLPTIKCSNVTINEQEGIFLDIKVYKGDRFLASNVLDTKVYQKPQNKYLYLPMNSFHPKSVFPSYITAELNRYRLICNNDNDFNDIKNDFLERLKERGYNPEYLSELFAHTTPRETLLKRLRNQIFQQEKPTKAKEKLIFKMQHMPQTKALRLKDCLELTDSMIQSGEGKILCGETNPIICYSNPPAIRSYFSQNRKKVHMLPLDNSMNLSIEDIDKFVEQYRNVVTDFPATKEVSSEPTRQRDQD